MTEVKTEVRIGDDYWQGDDTAVLMAWYFDDGDHVEAGDTIAEIMLEKTQMEIEAPVSGILRIRVGIEQPVKKGTLLAEII